MPFHALPTLPSVDTGPLDALPTKDGIGVRVCFQSEGTLHYGTVLTVSQRFVTVALERRWGHRTSVTLNWSAVRIAETQTAPAPPPPKPVIDPERVAMLKQSVQAAIRRPSHISHFNPTDAATLRATCQSMHTTLHEYLRNFEAMRTRIHQIVKDFHESREQCVAYGLHDLPPPVDTIRDIEVRLSPRRGRNGDHRRQLTLVREHARELLVSLLTHAADEGVSSEEVVAVLCDDEVTPHRIMGMLSALSRRGEARLGPNGKWKAT